MRYFRIPEIQFQRQVDDNITRDIKDQYVVIQQQFIGSTAYPNQEGMQLDRLAVLSYGTGNERSWYKIANRNIKQIVGWKLDSTQIKEYRVPSKNSYL